MSTLWFVLLWLWIAVKCISNSSCLIAAAWLKCSRHWKTISHVHTRWTHISELKSRLTHSNSSSSCRKKRENNYRESKIMWVAFEKRQWTNWCEKVAESFRIPSNRMDFIRNQREYGFLFHSNNLQVISFMCDMVQFESAHTREHHRFCWTKVRARVYGVQGQWSWKFYTKFSLSLISSLALCANNLHDFTQFSSIIFVFLDPINYIMHGIYLDLVRLWARKKSISVKS